MEAAVAALVMAIGLAGVVIPGLPGVPLIWLAALGYGLATHFGTAGWTAMVVITALLVVGTVAKYVLAQRGARASGAPRSTVVVGAIAGVVGFFVIPVIGFVIGGVLGVLLAEQRRLGNWDAAWTSSKAVFLGFGLGLIVELGAGVAMVMVWAIWLLT